MRILVFIIVVLLLAYVFWPRPEPVPEPVTVTEPVPVEETLIGDQIKPLRKAEKFREDDHLKALDQHREKMDNQADEG